MLSSTRSICFACFGGVGGCGAKRGRGEGGLGAGWVLQGDAWDYAGCGDDEWRRVVRALVGLQAEPGWPNSGILPVTECPAALRDPSTATAAADCIT